MSDELADFYVHTVTVETLTGTDGYGRDIFAAPVDLTPASDTGCFVEYKRRMVRDKDGVEVVLESTLATYPAAHPLFTPGSRVTIRGAQTRVITAALADLATSTSPTTLVTLA